MVGLVAESNCVEAIRGEVTAINTLRRGWERVRRNDGAPGVDRLSVERFEAHAETRLGRLQTALLEGSYRLKKRIRRSSRYATQTFFGTSFKDNC